MFKKMLRKITAAILCVTTLFTAVPVSAASTGGEYVSEVRMSWSAESADKATDWLKENGYQVIDNDLNATTGEGWAYLGYKTTSNPDEAITDIKVMNMKGGFAVSDTAAAVEKLKSSMVNDANYIIDIVDIVRDNFNAGSPYAKAAVEGLNCYTYDGNGTLLGDKLMDGVTNDEMVKLVFYTQSIAVSVIMNMLAIGLRGNNEPGWTQVMADNIEGANSYNEEQKDFAFDELYPMVTDFVEQYKEINTKFEKDGEKGLDDSELAFLAKSEAVFSVPVGNGTLLEYLLKEGLTAEDLFPMAAAITKEQVTIAAYIGFLSSGLSAIYTENDIENLIKDFAEVEKASVFEGIDESSLDKTTAVTVNAGREMQLDRGFAETNAAALIFTTGIAAIGIASSVVMFKISSSYAQRATFFVTRMEASMNSVQRAVFMKAMTSAKTFARGVERASIAINEANIRAIQFKCFGVAVIAMVAVMTLASTMTTISSYFNPEYTEIPYYMMDATQNPKTGENIYVNYTAVLDGRGVPGDLNTWEGKTWNAVYTTKDPNAGKPMYANFIHQSDNAEAPEGAYPVSNFGQNVAANLNQDAFSYDNSIFLFVSRNENFISSLASVFGGIGGIAVLIGAGLLVGALGGSLITYQVQKKRRRQSA